MALENWYASTPSSVSVAEMETFFGPWAEISVLKEDVMGQEHEQAQRFKVSVSRSICFTFEEVRSSGGQAD